MAEGIKLYKHFTEQLNRMGKPKRVWFTTFNLDIHFFEKYMLSALLGYPYRELKSPYDYESLNAQLANDPHALQEDKVEVRVFYDYRALQLGNKPKQTSVHLHPIDIALLAGLPAGLKFHKGVFHPKVVLLETVTGEYWLMVSSANLTFGGWAKNRECFFCEKIENTSVAREVGIFFQRITDSIRGFEESPLLKKLTSGKLGQKECKWRFFSSFSPSDFLSRLNPYEESAALKVWSPYYADDLDKILLQLQEEGYFDDIEIVPAKNERQKIRITKEVYGACLQQEGVAFQQDRLPSAAQESFVHAKVWLTPHTLAIGSWNMTRSGMNISTKANNNIEAGIIYDLGKKEYEQVLELYSTGPLKPFSHYAQDELEEEKEDILEKYSVSVDLVADWNTLTIQLTNPTYNKLINQLGETCIIKLPGIGASRIDILEKEVPFRGKSIELLTDRMFEIEGANGKTLFKGYIREVGLANRPVNSFGSIDDYLKGWVLERPEDKQELHRLAYKVDEEFGDELSQRTREILKSDSQNAWFTSFHAFECIIRRIDQTFITYRYKKEQVAELKRIGRVLPGSLFELHKHLSELKECFVKDKSNFFKSAIYLWFLIEKANYVFKHFNNIIRLEEEFIERIKNISAENLLAKEHIDKLGKDKLEKWMGFIKTKLRNHAYQS